jgi:hypothetical protein
MNIDKIINFEGKRNCALTFIIPPHTYFQKSINQINKKINGLKHENKKRQLRRVLNKIIEETKDTKQYDKFGKIICCGLNNSSQIEYYIIEPVKKIKDMEYFYDYKFHLNKIFQNIYKTVDYIDKKKQKNYLEQLNKLRNDGMLIYHKELNKFTEQKLIKNVLYFSNNIIDKKLIDESIDNNFNIKIFTLDKIILDDIIKKFGNYIGILHYKVEWIN